MKHSIYRTRRTARSLHIIRIASLLALTTISVAAKADLPCAPMNTDATDWSIVENSSATCVYVKPGVDWTRYAQLNAQPSSFSSNGGSEVRGEDVRKLIIFFDEKLRSAFPEQTLDGRPSITIRPVITAVRRSASAANAVSTAVIRVPVSYGGATVRFDLVDTASNKTIGVIIDQRRGKPWNGFQGLRSLGHSRVVLNGSAKRAKSDIERLQRTMGPARLSAAAAE